MDHHTLMESSTRRRTSGECPNAIHEKGAIRQVTPAPNGGDGQSDFETCPLTDNGMNTWPATSTVRNSTQGEKRKVKATLLPYPLLEGGALTSATLREDHGQFAWVTAQNRTSSTNDGFRIELYDQTRAGRKLVCSENAVLAFPATQSPQSHQRTATLLQRAEQGVRTLCSMIFVNLSHMMQAHFLRTHYPDVDIPSELIREQVAVEVRLEDSLRAFDPLVGDLVTSFHVSDGSEVPWSFIAFPMGESGCDLSESISRFL